jgi:hypothetical protein
VNDGMMKMKSWLSILKSPNLQSMSLSLGEKESQCVRLGSRSNSSPSGLGRGFIGLPALHAGPFTFDPFGIGAKAPKTTSILDALRLKALNMISPRQSLGRRRQKPKPEGLES